VAAGTDKQIKLRGINWFGYNVVSVNPIGFANKARNSSRSSMQLIGKAVQAVCPQREAINSAMLPIPCFWPTDVLFLQTFAGSPNG
jgi:hypothetical protein